MCCALCPITASYCFKKVKAVVFPFMTEVKGVILASPTLVSTSAGFSFFFRFIGKESHPKMWLKLMSFY
ncbi:hypothetical protein LWI28_028024 [Acer negundo]|uniref:Uncharacterized protein n=1 Tax=Acer negundo TaxID=4023 RepID=A0AAD5J1R9_ACENE|nr:hypothetical protein LWI28_028024 [Acer negundo]KAK4848777.1 hypothetical protein QYF36_017175 [Acer negundo]